jgi:ribose transport system permease protein
MPSSRQSGADLGRNRPSGAGPALRRVLLGNEFGLLLLIALFAVLFASSFPGFASEFGLYSLGRSMAVNVVIGYAMMVVIVSGGLNLAVGAIGACAAMTFGWANQGVGLPVVPALAAALALAGALGWINGIITRKAGIHSFVVTLATMSIFFGVMIFLTGAEAYRELSPAVAAFGRARLWGVVSPLIFVTLAVTLALIGLYRFTALGREMLAAGASEPAAALSGVRVDAAIVWSHVLSGLLAAIAALMLTARSGAALPSLAGNLGQDWLLLSFLAPVLGGTLLTGGHVSVVGTLLGGVLVTLLQTGLLFLDVGAFWQQSVLGGLLLTAVLIDVLRRRYLRHRGLA